MVTLLASSENPGENLSPWVQAVYCAGHNPAPCSVHHHGVLGLGSFRADYRLQAKQRLTYLRKATSNPRAALLAHDLAPGGLRVSADSLRHVIAVEAQVRHQLRVVPLLV